MRFNERNIFEKLSPGLSFSNFFFSVKFFGQFFCKILWQLNWENCERQNSQILIKLLLSSINSCFFCHRRLSDEIFARKESLYRVSSIFFLPQVNDRKRMVAILPYTKMPGTIFTKILEILFKKNLNYSQRPKSERSDFRQR